MELRMCQLGMAEQGYQPAHYLHLSIPLILIFSYTHIGIFLYVLSRLSNSSLSSHLFAPLNM